MKVEQNQSQRLMTEEPGQYQNAALTDLGGEDYRNQITSQLHGSYIDQQKVKKRNQPAGPVSGGSHEAAGYLDAYDFNNSNSRQNNAFMSYQPPGSVNSKSKDILPKRNLSSNKLVQNNANNSSLILAVSSDSQGSQGTGAANKSFTVQQKLPKEHREKVGAGGELISLTYEGRTVSQNTKIFNQGINQMKVEQQRLLKLKNLQKNK